MNCLSKACATTLCGLVIIASFVVCRQEPEKDIPSLALPSAYTLTDDVQYFPHGPEPKLANQIRALERYKLERQAQLDGADDTYEQ